MTYFKISRTTIVFLFFLVLLLLSPSKTTAQEHSITFYVLASDMRTLYLPGPSKVHKVNVSACSDQNRNGGYQLGIALLNEGTQVAYQDALHYSRSGCPMWSYGGSAEGTALDFGGTGADAVRIIPIWGFGTYYYVYVTYEEGYVSPPTQCDSDVKTPEYFDFSVPWCNYGNFTLPEPVKIHQVNLYGCCDQNRGGGCTNSIALYYQGAQVAYQGTLGYGRSGCPMWSYGGSPPNTALNFGGVLADTIRAIPTGRCGAWIWRIYYIHEPPKCSYIPAAVASISTNGQNYGDSVTVGRGVPTPIYLSAAGSSHPGGWDKVSNGGYCEWNSDLNPGSPTFEQRMINPLSPEACNVSLGELVFNDAPGTYTYGVLKIVDKNGIVSNIASVKVAVQALPPNLSPSASNLSTPQADHCLGSGAVFLWNFTDPDAGDTQTAYQIQVDNNSDFSSPEFFTGKIISSSHSYATFPGDLSWNTTYYWRLKVWDSFGYSSDWIYSPSSPGSPTAQPGTSFKTPVHAYPYPNFTHSPVKPSIDEIVNFTDISKCYSSSDEYNCKDGGSIQYAWDFDYIEAEGFTVDSIVKGNATTTFSEAKPYEVRLRITDNSLSPPGICIRGGDSPVGTTLRLPSWKEIPPF